MKFFFNHCDMFEVAIVAVIVYCAAIAVVFAILAGFIIETE